MNYKTPLAGAQGLGSAGQGTHHWWMQRLTAIALIPLGIWFAFAIASIPNASYEQVVHWIAEPINTLLLLAFIVAGVYHAMLGIQVVLEDYVHTYWMRLSSIIATKLLLILLALASILATLRIAFTSY